MEEEKPPLRIPFVLLNYRSMEETGRRMKGLAKVVGSIRPKLGKELEALEIPIRGEYYSIGAFFSALIYGLLAFDLVMFALTYSATMPMNSMIRFGAAAGLSLFMAFFMLHLYYPVIIVRKISARSDKDLLYALREVMLSINSGIPLFDSIKNVSLGSYGKVSLDFGMIVRQVESGTPMKDALRNQALLSESEFFKRAMWQMINALETGASMSTAMPGIVDALETQTYRNIRTYSSNLNFLMLIYMLVAAAIPSLGITFLVLLSAFSGFGISLDKIIGLVAGAAIGQLLLISYMSSTRPDIFGG